MPYTLDEVLLDVAQRAALLQAVAADVEREVVRVDKDLDPVEPLGQEVLAQVRRDEDATDKQLERVERDVRLGVKVVGHGGGQVDERAERGRASVAL